MTTNTKTNLPTELHNVLMKATSLIGHLENSVDRIDKMIGIVRNISNKTDLLALNASIEAARAGQSGKGFAVVAHEVARLSEKAQESIEEVESVCEGLRGSFRELSESLDLSLSKSKELLDQQEPTKTAEAA